MTDSKRKLSTYLNLEWIKCINGMCQTINNFFILGLECPWKINTEDKIFDFLRIKKLTNVSKFWYFLLTKHSIPNNKGAGIIFVYAITVSAYERDIKNIFYTIFFKE